MKQVVKVAKIGKNVFSNNPNDYIFHSDYNTFKIVLESTKEVTLSASTNNQIFTQAHGLSFIPLITALAKDSSLSQIFAPNSTNIELWGPKLGAIGDVKFNYIAANDTNLIFNFDNQDTSQRTINIRYYCLEKI